jgi:hypothetical protein
MVAYNFQAQFAPDVESRKKRQTIRKDRKARHARPGDAVQLYTAQRTPACRLLAESTCCGNTYVAIYETGVTLGNLPKVGLDEFARNDGFTDFEHMKQWFRDTHGLPFVGRLIQWL